MLHWMLHMLLMQVANEAMVNAENVLNQCAPFMVVVGDKKWLK
jgi:hypothetical protein